MRMAGDAVEGLHGGQPGGGVGQAFRQLAGVKAEEKFGLIL